MESIEAFEQITGPILTSWIEHLDAYLAQNGENKAADFVHYIDGSEGCFVRVTQTLHGVRQVTQQVIVDGVTYSKTNNGEWE